MVIVFVNCCLILFDLMYLYFKNVKNNLIVKILYFKNNSKKFIYNDVYVFFLGLQLRMDVSFIFVLVLLLFLCFLFIYGGNGFGQKLEVFVI